MPDLNRRGFLAGLSALVAAPAIIRSGLIMPIKPTLVLPPKIGAITFPIEGYGLGAARATFEDGAWASPLGFVPPDSIERWERFKKREAARFAEIQERFGGPVNGEICIA